MVMETTIFLSKVIGPVLVLRGISILIDRKHFAAMLRGVEKEISTVSFSLFPIALVMSCIALALVHKDTSSIAAIFLHIIAWGGMLKGSLLILFPHVISAKARMIGDAGFIYVVTAVCLGVGAYFTWFGFFGA